jgi:hypothetical protein
MLHEDLKVLVVWRGASSDQGFDTLKLLASLGNVRGDNVPAYGHL